MLRAVHHQDQKLFNEINASNKIDYKKYKYKSDHPIFMKIKTVSDSTDAKQIILEKMF